MLKIQMKIQKNFYCDLRLCNEKVNLVMTSDKDEIKTIMTCRELSR